MARYGVGDFSSFGSCKKKYSLFDHLGENNKSGSVGGCIVVLVVLTKLGKNHRLHILRLKKTYIPDRM